MTPGVDAIYVVALEAGYFAKMTTQYRLVSRRARRWSATRTLIEKAESSGRHGDYQPVEVEVKATVAGAKKQLVQLVVKEDLPEHYEATTTWFCAVDARRGVYCYVPVVTRYVKKSEAGGKGDKRAFQLAATLLAGRRLRVRRVSGAPPRALAPLLGEHALHALRASTIREHLLPPWKWATDKRAENK